MIFKSSLKIETIIAKDPDEIMGINTQEELREAEEIIKATTRFHKIYTR